MASIYLVIYLANSVELLRWRLRANEMLSSGVEQAFPVVCGARAAPYERWPYAARASNDIHAEALEKWAVLSIESTVEGS